MFPANGLNTQMLGVIAGIIEPSAEINAWSKQTDN